MRTLNMRPALAASLAVVLFLTALPANAKCKFNVDTVHSRTGEKVLWTKWNTFTLMIKGKVLVGSGLTIGDKKYFALRFDRRVDGTMAERNSALVIPEGGKLLIKLDDQSIHELYTEEEFTGDVDGGQSEIVARYVLDADTLNALLKKRIMNIRIQTTGADEDFAFGKKGAKKMQKTLACI
jgi:hypothetical protein